MTIINNRRQGAYGLAMTAVLSHSTAAYTEEENRKSEHASKLEEVVVTARKREENLLQVPTALTVISESTIEDAGIRSVADYAVLVPNVSFQNPFNFGDIRISVRGVSQVQNGAPPVAMVVDGVNLISPTQFNMAQFDMAQIEVLKGPQGAMYGRNAIMGAINIRTRQPSHTREGYAKLTAGSGEDYGVQAAMGGPIVKDRVSYRVAANWRDRRGELQNRTNGLYNDALEDASGRLQLRYFATENWSLDFKLEYADTEGGDPSYQAILADGEPNSNSGKLVTDTKGFTTRELLSSALVSRWQAAGGELMLNIAYLESNEDLFGDLDLTRLPALAAYQAYDEEGVSQEARFTSNEEKVFRWMVGAYNLDLEKETDTRITADVGVLTGGDLTGTSLDLLSTDISETRSKAVFAQGELDITDTVELALALRYDDDEMTITSNEGVSREYSASKLQPQVTVTYHAQEDLSVYASYGAGFRSGGLNPTTVPASLEVLRAEEAETVEIGTKARLLEGSFYLSGALFYTNLDDAQQMILDASTGSNIGINVDESRLWGGELESGWQLSDELNLTAAVGATNSNIERYEPDVAAEGNDLPRVPSYTFALTATYERRLSADTNLFTRWQYTGQGEMSWHVDNRDVRDRVDYLNGRLGLRDPGGVWEITAWVNNIGDERATGDFQASEFTGNPFDAFAPEVGRTWGVDLLRRL